jgi:hypothetical protein
MALEIAALDLHIRAGSAASYPLLRRSRKVLPMSSGYSVTHCTA